MIVLKNARIITDGKVIPRAWVGIEGNRLEVVEPGEPAAGIQGEMFDLDGKSVLPGLVNAHIHFAVRRVYGPLSANVGLSVGALAFRAVRSALCCLRDGVTSARDPGHKHLLQCDLREAIEKGVLPGPRIRTSRGSIVMSYGHGHLSGNVVVSVEEALTQVRRQASEGADFIKVLASHDDLPKVPEHEPCVPWFPAEGLKAIAELAHSTGMRTTAHANGSATIGRVVDAGFDCIEHGIYLTDNLARRMADSGMFLCPTMTTYKQNADPKWSRGEDWHRRYASLWAAHQESVRRALKFGVRLAVGTDNLGDMVEEIKLLADCGMAPMEAIHAATSGGATLLGLREIGSVRKGFPADLAVVDGNPVQEIDALRRVSMVFKDGKRYHPDSLRQVIPNSSLFMDDPNMEERTVFGTQGGESS